GYYDFRHQLLRDAIYGDVPPSQLRRYHARAAEFVMNLEASNIVHASRHYERAGLRPQAFRTSLTAAREASRISARHEAFELYERAVANMPADLPIEEQAELFARSGEAAAAIERNAEAAAAGARARELYLQLGKPIEAADMLILMSVLPARNGSPGREVREIAERAIAELADLPDSPELDRERAFLLSARANDHFLLSEFDAARADIDA